MFFRADTFLLNMLAFTFLYAGFATAWNIIGGFGGQFSLAHGVFFAVGAYVTANLFLRYADLALALAASRPLLLAAGVAARDLLAEPSACAGPFFAIATMAFNEVVFVLVELFRERSPVAPADLPCHSASALRT